MQAEPTILLDVMTLADLHDMQLEPDEGEGRRPDPLVRQLPHSPAAAHSHAASHAAPSVARPPLLTRCAAQPVC